MRFRLPLSLIRSSTKRVRNTAKAKKVDTSVTRRRLRHLLIEGLEERRVLAAFAAGNLAIYRIGDGSAALTSGSTAVFVDEYTPSGTLIQSIALPTTASGGNNQLTASGTATSEGMLTRSSDGQFLVLTGYAANTGTASIAGTNSTTVPRTLGRIDSQGNVNTSTTTTAFNTNNIRSAASIDGTSIYAVGANTGVVLQPLGGTGAGTVVSSSTLNLRNINIFGGQLYVSSSSGSLRLASVGSGVPTNTGNTATNLPGFPTTGSPYQYFFADLSASVAGVDTVYVADDTPGTIQKFSLVGGNWTSNGSIATGTASTRGLTAIVNGASVSLFGTTGSSLITVVDTSGYNAAPPSTATSIASAGTNKVFRGIALAPFVTTSTTLAIATDSGSSSKNEGQSGTTTFSFTITRSGTITGATDVTWTVSGDGANAADTSDFVGNAFQTGTASFAANETSKSITINVQGDTAVESNEGFKVTLSNPTNGASLTAASASSTIANDDAAIAIQSAGVSLAEGNSGTTNFVFTVTRSGDTTQSQTVDYAVVGSGANQADAADFVGNAFPSGNVTFAATETSKTITIPVLGDVTVETDETFTVSVSNPPAGAILGNASSIGTIVDDDAVANVAITSNQASAAEGNTGSTSFTFTITRSNLLTGVTSVDWAVTGTGSNPASATDFTGGVFPSGSVTFAATETTKTITVDVSGETTIEPDEDFVVTLSNITGGAITGVTATSTILNDDASVALSAGQTTLAEGNSGSTPFTFTVTRTGFQGAAVTVDYAVTGSGTFQASGADFVGGALPIGTVSFAANELTKTITINVAGDTTIESDEGFTVTISNVTGGAALGTATASSTILNDDIQALLAGDVVITGLNSTNPDQFSFVPLVDLAASSTLTFTDNAYTGTALGTSEGNLTYTAPAIGGLTKGSKVVLQVASGVVTVVSGLGTGTATSSFALNASGDNLFVYQGSSTSPNFLFGVNTNTSYLTSGSTTASTTYLPPGLTIGTSAVEALGKSTSLAVANAEYDHTKGTSGSYSAVLALVANVDNWTTSSSVFSLNQNNFTLNAAPTITDVLDQNTNEDIPLNGVAFTIGDVDTPIGNLTVTATSSNTTLVPNANLVLGGSGVNRTVSISPAANLNGQTVITLSVSDGVGSTTDTFTLTVNSVNDAPVSANATDVTNEDITLTFAPADFAFSDPSDSPSNVLQSLLITSLPALGILAFNGTPISAASVATPFIVPAANIGLLTFAPVSNANGTAYASFKFRVQDDGGFASGGVDTSLGENTITIDVTPINDPPVAVAGNLSTNEDTTFNGTLVANDIDNAALTYSIVDASTANGTVTITNASTGAYSFVPNLDFFGTGSFTFKANDGNVDSNIATVAISVNALNDAPVIAVNTGAAAVTSSSITIGNIRLRSTDVDNTASQLTYTLSSLPTLGTLKLNGFNITSLATTFTQADIDANLLTYAANSSTGSDGFSFSVADTALASVSGTFSIAVGLPGNLAPTSLSLSISNVEENKPIGTAVGTFSTVDPNSGDTFTYSLVSGTGSTNNASFTIVGNQLRTAESFDFETKSSYSILVQTADQGNLTFEQSFIITIIDTAEAPVITVTSGNKVYDKTAYVPVTTVSGVSGPVSNPALTYTFYVGAGTGGTNLGPVAPINAGTYTVVAAFAGNANYLAGTSSPTTFLITPKQLTATISAQNKQYNGSAAATVTYALTGGVLAGDTVTVSGTSASFNDKNVGNGKLVTATGIVLGGASVNNYGLTSTSATTTANITTRTLTSTAAAVNKIYDGTANATLNFSDDRISGDTFTYNYLANFPDKNIGNLKRVSFSNVTITGGDALNYTLSINTLSIIRANITTRALSVTATGTNKVYDGTTTASVTLSDNRIVTDTLTTSFSGAAFTDRNAGTAKTINVSGISISGTDAFNYSLQNTTTTTTANITPRSLTGSATAPNKVYDGNTNTTVTVSLTGVLPVDSSVSGTASGNFVDKNVGIAKAVTVGTVTLTGAGSGNYTPPTIPNTSANITPRALLVSGAGVNKVYDGNTNATVTLSDNRVSGDVLTTSYVASFADKNVGNGKSVSVSSINLTGTDAANYTFNTTSSTTANITQRALVVSAAGINKVYDGNTNATVTLSDNRASGDVLTTSFAGASFSDKNVGNGKSVNVTGINVTGTDAANYTFNTTASTTANITTLAVTPVVTVNNKNFDGNTSATIATRNLVGAISGDVVSLTGGTATFVDAAVGLNKPVNVTGLSLTGDDALNYSVSSTASTTASILVAPTVNSVALNGGTAQRSQLTSIIVTFNTPVTLSSGAFTIGQYSLTSFNSFVRSIAQSQIIVTPNAGSATTFTITFGVGPGVQTRTNGNSLVDGNYRLTVDATKVTGSTGSNMSGNYQFGHNPNLAGHDTFFRLYGDSDGDGDVDGTDRIAFNRAATTYNAAMDYNGNGVVDSSDFSFFSSNLNKRRSKI